MSTPRPPLLTLDDGTIALVSATRYNGAGYDVRLEALGSRDSLVTGLDEHTPLPRREPATGPSGDAYGGFLERFGPAYEAELAAFVDLGGGTWRASLPAGGRAGGPVRGRGVRTVTDRGPRRHDRGGPQMRGGGGADLLGRLRGTRLGAPAHAGTGAARRWPSLGWRPPSSGRTDSCPVIGEEPC